MHIEVFHLPYLKWFKENGYETHVCARNDYENKQECNIAYCDKFFDLPFERSPFRPNNIVVYKELKKIIESNEYDIIHCHTPIGGVLTRLASRKSRKNGTKVIYTAHGFHFYKGSSLKNWLLYYPVERILARFTDTLITINKEDFARAQDFNSQEVVYVPGVGVDVKKFNSVAEITSNNKKELGISNEQSILLSVGELSGRKNHEVIIKSLAKIDDPNIVYLICGQGDLENYLKRLAEDLNVNVKFLGFRKDIPEICSIADLYVFPSYQEGLPVALMEAMAAGLPIICSAIRGNTDLIVDGKGGFLVEPDDIDGFTEAIKKSLKDEVLREKMARYNLKEIKLYEKETVIEKMQNIYRKNS